MIKKTLRATSISISAFVAIAANAQTPTTSDDVESAYSQCGIGAAIFQKNETAAIISNVVWDLGTTALSSQTSSPSSCSGVNKKAAAFIYETYPILEEDVVKGSGAHLSALMEMVGCDDSSAGQVAASMQTDLIKSLESGADSRLDKSKQMGASLDQARTLCTA